MFPKKILTFLSFVIICFSSISKVYSIEADVFVQSTVNRAAKTLSGDFTKNEVDKAIDLKFKPVSLGESRFRAETAAIIATHTVSIVNM